MTTVLSSDDLARFDRDGFLVVEAITDHDEIAAMVDVYDRLFTATAEIRDGDRLDLVPVDGDDIRGLPQVMYPERYAPTLVTGAAYRTATAIAVQLLGPGVIGGGNHAICKPAHHGAPTPWHQDEAYWDPRFDHRAISIWVPLQDVTQHNGCMEFVPGSHRGPVVAHELIDEASHGLQAVGPIDTSMAVACPLAAGGATIHGGRTLHFAGPNRSSEARRALVFAFGLEPVPRATPASRPWQRRDWYGPAGDLPTAPPADPTI